MATTLSDRVTALEISQTGLEDSVRKLGDDVRGAQHDARQDMEKFSAQMQLELNGIKATLSTLTRTNWPVLIAAAGLAFTIAGGIAGIASIIGSLAYSNLNQRIEANDTRLSKELEMRADQGRRAIEDLSLELHRQPKP